MPMATYERDDDGKLYCKAHFMQNWLGSAQGSARQLGGAIPMPAPPTPAAEPGSSETQPAAASRLESVVSPPSSARLERLVSLGPSPAAPVAPSVGCWVASQTPRCVRCLKNVYHMERQDARAHGGDVLTFHKACFRCADCNTLLGPNNWELCPRGELCCRVHYTARRTATVELT